MSSLFAALMLLVAAAGAVPLASQTSLGLVHCAKVQIAPQVFVDMFDGETFAVGDDTFVTFDNLDKRRQLQTGGTSLR